MSVDARHTGSASGFNSAVARTGGLVVTALIAPVISATGPSLSGRFAVAAAIGSVLCMAAALSALLWIRTERS
jgi:hypothetical protein